MFKTIADLEYVLNVQISILMTVGIIIGGDCILTNKPPGLDPYS